MSVLASVDFKYTKNLSCRNNLSESEVVVALNEVPVDVFGTAIVVASIPSAADVLGTGWLVGVEHAVVDVVVVISIFALWLSMAAVVVFLFRCGDELALVTESSTDVAVSLKTSLSSSDDGGSTSFIVVVVVVDLVVGLEADGSGLVVPSSDG